MKSKNTILLIAIFVQLNACAQNAEPNSQKESKINSAVAVQLRTIDENGVVQNVEQSNTQTSNEIKFVERWTVSSAFVTENQKLEKSDLLDSEAFFEFFKNGTIKFKINKNYPVQQGVFKQQELEIVITSNVESCPVCINEFSIRRTSIQDTIFTLTFSEFSQSFEVTSVRQ